MIKNNKGIIIWITGIPGSGKTTLARKLSKYLIKKEIPFFELSGDDIREVFKFNEYKAISRLQLAKKYSDFLNKLSKKKINVCFSTVALFHQVQKKNKKQINNYFQIYIETQIDSIIKLNKKKIYKSHKKNLWGKDIVFKKPIFSDLIIKNYPEENKDPFNKEVLNKIYIKLNKKFKFSK